MGLFFCLSAFTKTSNGQAQLQSMFIYNFIKLIDWPASYKTGDFVIGVYGNSAITGELQKMAASKKAGTQNIKIVNYNSAGAISKCHILFIPATYNAQLGAIYGSIGSASTLVITESKGMINKGAGINFVLREGKMTFELNQSKILAQNMKISSHLSNLAALVK